LLPDGRVLVAGAKALAATTPRGVECKILATAELLRPSDWTFSLTGSMNEARWGLTATLLADGRCLNLGAPDRTGALLLSRTLRSRVGKFSKTER